MNELNLSPQVISRIMGEIRELNKKPAEGIEFTDNEENSVSEIHAVITGPEGTPFYKESSLNDEAGKLFMDSYDEFARRARLMTDVHAIDELEENEDEEPIERRALVVDDVSSKVAATEKICDGVDTVHAEERAQSVFSQTADKILVKAKTKKVTDKTKEAKKKSLKRL